MTPTKGDRYRWYDLNITISRVSKDGTWADIRVHSGTLEWGKRQKLPFPATFTKETA